MAPPRPRDNFGKFNQISETAEIALMRDHRRRSQLHCSELLSQAIELPRNPKLDILKKIDPKMVQNARTRLDLTRLASSKNLLTRSEVKVYHSGSKPSESSKRDFPQRFIYFILDGQDFNDVDNFHFSFLEVNEKLCRLVPQKTWNSQACQRLNFNQKVEFACPPEILLKQVILELV